MVIDIESIADPHSRTPDGRYFVVRGRLWRLSNPNLETSLRAELVSELMAARRELRSSNRDVESRAAARKRVDHVKAALGERGAVWWADGAPDFNRRMASNTPYRGWYEALQGQFRT